MGHLQGGRDPQEAGLEDHPGQEALQVPHAPLGLVGDEGEHVLGDGGHVLEVSILELFPQDGDAGLEVGRLDVGSEAPLEAGDQPLVAAFQLLGGLVGGDDDLLPVLEQVLKDVEDLLLGPLHLPQRLHVIQKEHVVLLVFLAHGLGILDPDGHRQLVEEVVHLDIGDPQPWVALQQALANPHHQVSLAEAGAAIDEQRVHA